MIIIVRTSAAIGEELDKIRHNASLAQTALNNLPDDPIVALTRIKFEPIGSHPLEERPLNIIEQVNQTFTYLVALKAARLLIEWHPDSGGYRLAPGAHAPKGTLDVESLVPGLVGAETFAAVRPENNRKLAGDLDKLATRSEQFRYVFFMSPLFPETKRRFEKERDGVHVWSIFMMD